MENGTNYSMDSQFNSCSLSFTFSHIPLFPDRQDWFAFIRGLRLKEEKEENNC